MEICQIMLDRDYKTGSIYIAIRFLKQGRTVIIGGITSRIQIYRNIMRVSNEVLKFLLEMYSELKR